ncbi:MAG: PQQ-dependent sugar dehydrogenase [Verrucomicrobia bacterium]|nr:PQQ-dependent sugar dehydrogenase [Verrucomicrobiota bacterium]
MQIAIATPGGCDQLTCLESAMLLRPLSSLLPRCFVNWFGVTWAVTMALPAVTLPARAADPLSFETVPVQVPSELREGTFDRERRLRVPKGFIIEVVARIARARFLMGTPAGNLLVSQPAHGKIWLVRLDGDRSVQLLASGLRLPQGMAFKNIDGATYLYVGECNEIVRFRYDPASERVSNREVIVPNLPDASSAGLGGAYGHELKNLAIGPDNKLYVDVASATNASPSDTTSNPVRSAIYQYDLDGSHGRIFARGIRNAEGLDFLPGTGELWAVVNERDEIRFPFHRPWRQGDGDDYGKRLSSYVDDHPPDELIHVKDGANYGWPFANPDPDTPSGLDNMPFDPDYDNNPDWRRFPESTFTRVDKGIQAHSAPLGMAFLQSSNVPEQVRHGLVTAYHGSWDRTRKTGYKVAYFPWTHDGRPGSQVDLVTGWLDDATQDVWGRPVDVKPGKDGALYISDDDSGTVYRLARAR